MPTEREYVGGMALSDAAVDEVLALIKAKAAALPAVGVRGRFLDDLEQALEDFAAAPGEWATPTKLYEYTVSIDGFEAVVIEATDANHAATEMMEDRRLWPDGATGGELIISIIRGEQTQEI